MINRIYPSNDTTIYEDSVRQLQNVSNDEILEIRKLYDATDTDILLGNSRILIKFDLSSVSQSISDGIISGSNIKHYLKMVSTEEVEIPTTYTLEFYPISQSWADGVGRFYDTPINENDVSWYNRQTDVSWSLAVGNSDFFYRTNYGGGNWFTSSVNNTTYSQSFTRNVSDINVDITHYVNDILSGSRPNNGFMIKLPQTDESSSIFKLGSAKYFSSNTNTIYSPVLETRWDNTTFTTASLVELNTSNIIVYLPTLKSQYVKDSKERIRVYGRERYPQRTFSNSGAVSTIKYLPSSSYWSLRDGESKYVIIPFDTTYTKLSCDGDGNYFDFWFDTLQPERYYEFMIRIDDGGNKQYYIDNFYFRLVR